MLCSPSFSPMCVSEIGSSSYHEYRPKLRQPLSISHETMYNQDDVSDEYRSVFFFDLGTSNKTRSVDTHPR